MFLIALVNNENDLSIYFKCGSSLSHKSGSYVIEMQLHYFLVIKYISSQTFEDDWNEAQAEIPSSSTLSFKVEQGSDTE